MRFFRDGEAQFEDRLRDARPEPPAELVSGIARRLQPPAVRRSPRLRLGLAAGLTSALLVAFAAVGGVGYAATAAAKAATAVSKAAGSDAKIGPAAAQKGDSHSNTAAPSSSTARQNAPDPHDPSHDQYGDHHVTICHRGHTLVLSSEAAHAHLARHRRDTPGACPH